MLPDSLGYIFQDAVESTPDAAALIAGDRQVSFGELDRRATRVGSALAHLGVVRGDRVALFVGNHVRFLEALFGGVRAGAIPVPLNLRYGDANLRGILLDCTPAAMIVGPDLAERAGRVAAGMPSLRHVVASEPIDAPVPCHDFERLLEAAPPPGDRIPVDRDDVCLLMYTSGSTGAPKGVMLTHGGQIWNAHALRVALEFRRGDRALVSAPLCHKNAMMGAVKPFLLAGGSIVILPAFAPGPVIDAIERHQVTFLMGVPAMYRRLLGDPGLLQGRNVQSVRFAKCGSATTPPDLLASFAETFAAPIVEGYGLTEGGPVPISHTRTGPHRHGSCGRALPGCEVMLRHPERPDAEVGENEIGELVVRNPGVTKGYWNRPDLTASRLRDGWLWTGDLMRRDADGYFYFVGRKDDMMNVSGENVYPREIENVLLQHPNIREVCVVPHPHAVKGVVPVAFVIEHEPGRLSEADVKQFFIEHGSPFAYPRRSLFVREFPLNSAGKVDRRQLVEQARALQADAPPIAV
ncbi:MAG: class I adenylate-forming enzyme family protein [Vicinamibacterales bacterium]